MRHRVAHRKLGRVTEHRIAMLRNQATALLRYEHLTTTVPRAKELRPFVERLITIAKRGVAGANGKALHARRLLMHDLQDQEVITKLFDTIAPRFAARPGGYTRLLRLGFRKAKAEGTEPKKSKGVGGRFRAAAERLRGKKDEDTGPVEPAPKRSNPRGSSDAKPRPKKQGPRGS
jgi:large subunit ribosomal protein L17